MRKLNELLLILQAIILIRIYLYSKLTKDNVRQQRYYINKLVKVSGGILGLMAAAMIVSKTVI